MSAAAVRGRSALGERAGRPVMRVGRDPDAPWVFTTGPHHAHLAGFDLHADRAVRADDRAGLEGLCRYVLRPPLAQDRLSRLPDGRVVCTLRRPWHDGTRHLVFTASDFLERLSAITPRPRINLVLYHGCLAPHARWRPTAHTASEPPDASIAAPSVVATTVTGPPGPAAPAPGPACPTRAASERQDPLPPRQYWTWADLLRRIFAIDVLACAACGGRLRLVATIEDPVVLTKILTHLNLPTTVPGTEPARSPPGRDLPFDFGS